MKYSLNPFKWILWLYRKVKYHNSIWKMYYYHKPLSKSGKASVLKEMRIRAKSFSAIVKSHNHRREKRMERFPFM